MNAPLDQAVLSAIAKISLDDKYTLDQGRAYMSGTQALVRLPMLQKMRDQRNGLNTAGFISGYRGSPLGALDQALWKAKAHLKTNDIVFQPGLNEDLAATSVWGTQQVTLYPDAKYDGVFGMWYGKGPGVDRSMDVFKHANSAGTSRHGGVLVLAGDDHGAKSSTVAHQSEHDFQSAGLPVLYPANVQEYLDYGLHGWAMSRYSGLWVAMKCVTEVVESSASIEIDPDRTQILLPEDFELPADGLNIRWPDPPLVQEARLMDYKWYAALAYTRANRLNRVVIDSPRPRFGIMTAGKAYLDTRQALADLGLTDDICTDIGIRLMKVGCVWPLNAQDAREFATGLDEILVVEEKRQILEYALKEELYNWRDDVRPSVYGKFDEKDHAGGEWSIPRAPWLLPARGELSPALIARAIARRLEKFNLPESIQARIAARIAVIDAKEREVTSLQVTSERKPWFCSGCPHNTSTRVPEGSRALAGIGCHYMTIWMDRKTETFSHMGGEGVSWIGQAPFTKEPHIFANLGDGTYFHSGILAIRASVAANVNITYKILYNDAVAMTGGQPVDGILKVTDVIAQVHAEGVRKIVVVTDEPEKFNGVSLVGNPPVYHRDQLDQVQRELRNTPGCTILVYDQTCATEKRRRRKRGLMPDPAKRAFINDTVCEGCGDCSVKSNCLSVEPLETPLGTKRRINQSSCNKDFSCVNGFCPSFVTLEGAQVRRPKSASGSGISLPAEPLPYPTLPTITDTYGVLVTGIGGTGVVTIGGLLGMAAHIENKGVTVLDMAGLAQKGGAVVSHIQIAARPDDIHATRIATGEAELILGCDPIVTTAAEVLSKVQKGITHAVVNSAQLPTADFIGNPSWRFPDKKTETELLDVIGSDCAFIDANACAVAVLGDAIYANPLLLGYAWQKGWIPLTHESLLRAIELNGVTIEKNTMAFEWGRQLAHHGVAGVLPQLIKKPTALVHAPHSKTTLDTLMAEQAKRLTQYQSVAYAKKFIRSITPLMQRERALIPEGSLEVTQAAIQGLAKLMAYKDEYEVARLYMDPAFKEKLREAFEGEPDVDYTIQYHLAPPFLDRKNAQQPARKKKYGPWMRHVFSVLARMKGLRGTPFDVFGYTAERKEERELITEYQALLQELATSLDHHNLGIARQLAQLPEEIRGFGHVKEGNLKKVRQQWQTLLTQYRAARPLKKAA